MKALLGLICIISTMHAEAITLYKHWPRNSCEQGSPSVDSVTIRLIVRLHGNVPDGNYTAKTNGNYGTEFYVGWIITVSGGVVVNPPGPVNAFNVLNFASPGPVDWDCDAQLSPPSFHGTQFVTGPTDVAVGNPLNQCDDRAGQAFVVTAYWDVYGDDVPLDENQTQQCHASIGCSSCATRGMASYSIHLLLASLHIEDTPISYNSPRGPSTSFKVVYNQREANQPGFFTYSNFGPKWTFNWLSYVTDDPNDPSVASAYVRGGGTEVYSGYDSMTESWAADKQTLAVLVRSDPANTVYERRFPDGSKEIFSRSEPSISYPRRVFLSRVEDSAGNAATLTYDSNFRIIAITDALNQATTIDYPTTGDTSRIKTVTDPFGRIAQFEYNGDGGQLSKIIDPIGIESEFFYETGTDFIYKMRTPYGDTLFARGQSGDSSRWIEVTDPTGGKERVEYKSASAISSSEPQSVTPRGADNNALERTNTFYWDKKYTTLYPPASFPYDYSKAHIIHWLRSGEGQRVSGVYHSEKLPLENRVWYGYPGQSNAGVTGGTAKPIRASRVLSDRFTPQQFQFEYNEVGNIVKYTDPKNRVTSYLYAANGIDLVAVYQQRPGAESTDPFNVPADKIVGFGDYYLHHPLSMTDGAGQITNFTYNPYGQLLTIENPRHEITTYIYDHDSGGGITDGYLISVASPVFEGTSAVTAFGYDDARRIHTVTTSPDNYTVTTDHDALDRPTQITYPDGTNQQLNYTEFTDQGVDTGKKLLDSTQVKDRLDRWTYRHFDGNRRMDWIKDPLGRQIMFEWCTCGALAGITDPNGNITKFDQDLGSRVTSKTYAYGTKNSQSTTYAYENATSRLRSMTDAKGQTTNYLYESDDNLMQVSYGGSLNPTPTVTYAYDDYYNRGRSMTAAGLGTLTYTYYPVTSAGNLGANQLQTVGGLFPNDTLTYNYDELGRPVGQSINGSLSAVHYDSLGRMDTSDNPLGHFTRSYDGVTPRLQTFNYPNGQTANYTYFGNSNDRRLQTLQYLATDTTNISRFEYTYDSEGTIQLWQKILGSDEINLTFGYDDAQQLISVNQGNTGFGYGYDLAGNRISNSIFTMRQRNGVETQYTANNLNQLDGVKRRTGLGRFSPPVPLSYDANGNLTADAEGKTYEWDAANRLVTINYLNSGNRTEFAYDGLGRRVKITEFESTADATAKSKSNSTRVKTTTNAKTFIWSGTVIAEERDATGANVAKRFFGEGEQRVGGADAGNYYYSRDHLGSIREVTDSTGALKAQYDYDAWGKSVTVNGDMNIDFGFTGHYSHQSSGLNLAMYRAYNATMGRWMTRDPIGEASDMNLYAYVHNGPPMMTDATGLFDGETWNFNKSRETGPVNLKMGNQIFLHDGRVDFRYHGRWGGPGWANGGWGSESAPLPNRNDTFYRPPVDAEDKCYEDHDRCINCCPSCPNRGNGCIRQCDHELANCLMTKLPFQTTLFPPIRIHLTALAFDTLIPWLVH